MIKVKDTYRYDVVFTQDDVAKFANLTGDINPVHLDPTYAATTPFKKQIVQGVLVSCAFSKVFGTMWPGSKDSYYISQDITYLKPVYVDERYSINFECTDVDAPRHLGTIIGTIVDENNNDIVKVKARIVSESQF